MTDQVRNAILTAYRRDETSCLKDLLERVQVPAASVVSIQRRARGWIETLRAGDSKPSALDALLREYDLSNEEGVILMCLAESLLRIPDPATADRLIEEKLSRGQWDRHLHPGQGLWSNAATWGLVVTGRWLGYLQRPEQRWLNLISRLGILPVRTVLKRSMAALAGQFVMGRTIAEALPLAGYSATQRYSFDCLGEAALTAAEAQTYFESYLAAIAALATRGGHQDRQAAPGVSVKLSALHPRYDYTHAGRLKQELLPRVMELALAARAAGIGLTLDAEEADRLDLSLEIFAAVLQRPELAGWSGFGLAVQAYQKRAIYVIDWLVALGRELDRYIPLRLVKGAYWDSEIKRAQERALDGYPVFTRKAATDVSYLACASAMLAADDVIYPQFATHNAMTIATILELAGAKPFEFQRLHGMGEALYQQVQEESGVAVRIYAPLGEHARLLPYLVRRLLENGANSSFVNRLWQEEVAIEALLDDPVARVRASDCQAHPGIPLPLAIYQPERQAGANFDLSDPLDREPLLQRLNAAAHVPETTTGAASPVTNPADGSIVGHVTELDETALGTALTVAASAAPDWENNPLEDRVAAVEKAATLLESRRAELLGLIVREAGRCIPDAMNEVREAVDFCRYYAARAREDFQHERRLPGPVGEENCLRWHGRGVFLCISPWNFPLAIFTGQVVAALVSGNCVLAKPASQTPLTALRVVNLLHEAGIPEAVLQCIPAPGRLVGDVLLADERLSGVVFTGSTDTARHIQRQLSEREGPIVPLIAETGGQNVMLADSSALPEQLVTDALHSAFNSAGQRCSALRVLCVQEDIAERVIGLLQGAMDELLIGDPGLLATDIGPVIDAAAQQTLYEHIHRMQREARLLKALPLPAVAEAGSFFRRISLRSIRWMYWTRKCSALCCMSYAIAPANWMHCSIRLMP